MRVMMSWMVVMAAIRLLISVISAELTSLWVVLPLMDLVIAIPSAILRTYSVVLLMMFLLVMLATTYCWVGSATIPSQVVTE